MMLGDLGADVIKIEAPGRGDDTRHWGPPFAAGGESAYFVSTNRNKRSLTLNLKSRRGQEILKQIIQQSDVVVENFRAGTMSRWGLDYEAMQAIRPGLIYCTITGYGHTGPYKDRPGYDFLVQAMGGFMSLTGPAEGQPMRAGVAIADLATGLYAGNAILAALYARERTGKGQRIDMSLLDSQVALTSYVASNFLVSGERPTRYGNGHPNIVPYQAFRARDQHFAFAAGNDSQWRKFCLAVAHPEWADDEKFATNAARLEHRDTVVEMLSTIFARQDASHWMSLCEEIGIPAAPINDLPQVFADPQVAARGLRIEVDHPSAGRLPMVASPINMPTAPVQIRYPPPLLGQHTDEILQSVVNIDQLGIDRLRESGVV
jgi:crotonobetainyl-CoA:carnitine CoA-transferase CaiB-like acyl-CoA transferase